MGCIQSKEPEPPAPAQPNRRVSAARKSKHGNGADGHKDAPAPPVPDEDPKVSPEELAESLTIQANSGDIHELYQFGKKIGAGGYAVVYKAVELKTNRQVAIKAIALDDRSTISVKNARRRISASQGKPVEPEEPLPPTPPTKEAKEKEGEATKRSSDELKYILREIELLKGLDHPNVIHLYDYFVSARGTTVYIVLEYAAGGDLRTALEKRQNYHEADACTAFRSLLKALEYLHSRGVVHRDLKLENLLLGDENDVSTVKIVDFGLAKQLYKRRKGMDPSAWHTICGTPHYIAPEIISTAVKNKANYSLPSAIDIWGAGVTLHCLLTGTLPFDDPNEARLFEKIVEGKLDLHGDHWLGVSEPAKALVVAMLQTDPSKRPTASMSLRHEWMRIAEKPMPAVENSVVKARLQDFVKDEPLPLHRVEDGGYLIHQGDRCKFVFFIKKGIVDVYMEERFGGEDSAVSVIPLGSCSAGQYIGEFSLFSKSFLNESVYGFRSEALLEVQQAKSPHGMSKSGRHSIRKRSGKSESLAAGGSEVSGSGDGSLGGGDKTGTSRHRRRSSVRFFNEGQEPAPCPFSVRARGDVDVLAIHRNDLKRLIDSDRESTVAACAEADMRVAWIEMRWRQSLARNRGLLEWEGGEPSFRPERVRRMSAPIMSMGARGGGGSDMDVRGSAADGGKSARTLSPRAAKTKVGAPAAAPAAAPGTGEKAKRGRRASVGGVPANRGPRRSPGQQGAAGSHGDAGDDAAAGGDAVDAADVGISLPPAEASKI